MRSRWGAGWEAGGSKVARAGSRHGSGQNLGVRFWTQAKVLSQVQNSFASFVWKRKQYCPESWVQGRGRQTKEAVPR